MSKYANFLLVALLGSANAATSFVGLWFSCEGTSGEFQSLSVERSGEHYTGLLESSRNGGVHSAQLTGSVRAGVLELRGCQANRGEAPPSCAPEVVVQLGARGSSFKRISPQRFERHIGECHAMRKES